MGHKTKTDLCFCGEPKSVLAKRCRKCHQTRMAWRAKDRVSRVVAFYEAGWSYRKIAEEEGVGTERVRQIIKGHIAGA